MAALTTGRDRCTGCDIQAGSLSQGMEAGADSGVGSLGRLESVVEDRQAYDPATKH